MSENPYEKPDLYLADCMEAMARFPDKYFQLAIVDPPYGINLIPIGGGGTSEPASRLEVKRHVYGASKKALSEQNFTAPSTISARRTKAISESLSA